LGFGEVRSQHKCDLAQSAKPSTLGTSKGSESISGSKSGTCLEALGYAGAEGWVIWFLELTLSQGFHTLLGLLSGLVPRLSGYMPVIEVFVVSPRPCKIHGVAVRIVFITTSLEISQSWKWYIHASQVVCNLPARGSLNLIYLSVSELQFFYQEGTSFIFPDAWYGSLWASSSRLGTELGTGRVTLHQSLRLREAI